MIVLEEFPGKRFLISKAEVIARNAGNGNKTPHHSLDYLSGTIKSCNKAPTEGCKRLKFWIQYDGKNVIEEIKPNRLRRQLLVEYILVEVTNSSKRLPALAFKQLFELFSDVDVVTVQHFGTRKIEKVPKTSLFPFKFKESKRETVSQAVLDDFGCWLRVQKTKLLLLKGPYSVSPSTVEIYSEIDGHKFKALLKCHDTFNRKLTVMENLQSKEVNPMLSEIQFNCSDEDLNQMLLGEAPKKHYSRYGKEKSYNIERMSPWHWMPPSWAECSASQYTKLFTVLKEPMKTSVIKVNPRKSLSSCTSLSSSSSSSSSPNSKQDKKKNKTSFLNATNMEVLHDNSTEDDLRAARLLKYMELEDLMLNKNSDPTSKNMKHYNNKDDNVVVRQDNLNQLELLKILYDTSDLSSESAQSTPTKVNEEKHSNAGFDGTSLENITSSVMSETSLENITSSVISGTSLENITSSVISDLVKTVESICPTMLSTTTVKNDCPPTSISESVSVSTSQMITTPTTLETITSSCTTTNNGMPEVAKYKESTKYVTEITEEVEYSPPHQNRSALQGGRKMYGKTTITHTICEEIDLDDNKNKPRLSSFQKRRNPKFPITMTPNKIKDIMAENESQEDVKIEKKSLISDTMKQESSSHTLHPSPINFNDSQSIDLMNNEHNLHQRRHCVPSISGEHEIKHSDCKPNNHHNFSGPLLLNEQGCSDDFSTADNRTSSSFKDMARFTYYRDKSYLLKEPTWEDPIQSGMNCHPNSPNQHLTGKLSQKSCKPIEQNHKSEPTRNKKEKTRNTLRSKALLKILTAKGNSLEYMSIVCLQTYIKKHKIPLSRVKNLLAELNNSLWKNERAEGFYRSLLIAEQLPKLPRDNSFVSDISFDDPSFDWPLIYAKLQSFNDVCYSELANLKCQEDQSNVPVPQSVNFIQNYTVNVLPSVLPQPKSNENSQFPLYYGHNQPMILPSPSAITSKVKTEFPPQTCHQENYHNSCNSSLLPNYAHPLDYHRLNNLLPEGYHVPDMQTTVSPHAANIPPNQPQYYPWQNNMMLSSLPQNLSSKSNPPLATTNSNTPTNHKQLMLDGKKSSTYSSAETVGKNVLAVQSIKESIELNETLDDEFLESILGKSGNVSLLENLMYQELPIKTEASKMSSQSNAVTVIINQGSKRNSDFSNKSRNSPPLYDKCCSQERNYSSTGRTAGKKESSMEVKSSEMSSKINRSTNELFDIAVTNYMLHLYRNYDSRSSNAQKENEKVHVKQYIDSKTSPPPPSPPSTSVSINDATFRSNTAKSMAVNNTKHLTIPYHAGIMSSLHPKHKLKKIQHTNESLPIQKGQLECTPLERYEPRQNQTQQQNYKPGNKSLPQQTSVICSTNHFQNAATQSINQSSLPKHEIFQSHIHGLSQNQNQTIAQSEMISNKENVLLSMLSASDNVEPSQDAMKSPQTGTILQVQASLHMYGKMKAAEHEIPPKHSVENETIQKSFTNLTATIPSVEIRNSQLLKVFQVTDSHELLNQRLDTNSHHLKDDSKLENDFTNFTNERLLKCFVVEDSHKDLFEMMNFTSNFTTVTTSISTTLPISITKYKDKKENEENKLSKLPTKEIEEKELSKLRTKEIEEKELSKLRTKEIEEKELSKLRTEENEENKLSKLPTKEIEEKELSKLRTEEIEENKLLKLPTKTTKTPNKKKVIKQNFEKGKSCEYSQKLGTSEMESLFIHVAATRNIEETTTPEEALTGATFHKDQSMLSPSVNPSGGDKNHIKPTHKESSSINPMISNVKSITQPQTPFKVTDILLKPDTHPQAKQCKLEDVSRKAEIHAADSSTLPNITNNHDPSRKDTMLPNKDHNTNKPTDLHILRTNEHINEENMTDQPQVCTQVETKKDICYLIPLSKSGLKVLPNSSVMNSNASNSVVEPLSIITSPTVPATMGIPSKIKTVPFVSSCIIKTPSNPTPPTSNPATPTSIRNKCLIKLTPKDLSDMLSKTVSASVKTPGQLYFQVARSQPNYCLFLMGPPQTSLITSIKDKFNNKFNVVPSSLVSPTEIKVSTDVWKNRQCKSLPTSPVTRTVPAMFPPKSPNNWSHHQGPPSPGKTRKRKNSKSGRKRAFDEVDDDDDDSDGAPRTASRRSSRSIVTDTHLKMHQCQFDEEDGEDELVAPKNQEILKDDVKNPSIVASSQSSSADCPSPSLTTSMLSMQTDVELASATIKKHTAEDTRKVKSYMSDEIWSKHKQPPKLETGNAKPPNMLGRNSPPFLSISTQISSTFPEQSTKTPVVTSAISVSFDKSGHKSIKQCETTTTSKSTSSIPSTVMHQQTSLSCRENVPILPLKTNVVMSGAKSIDSAKFSGKVTMESLMKQVQLFCNDRLKFSVSTVNALKSDQAKVLKVQPNFVIKPIITSVSTSLSSPNTITTSARKCTIPIISKAAENNEKKNTSCHKKLTSPFKVMVTDCKQFAKSPKDAESHLTDISHKKRKTDLCFEKDEKMPKISNEQVNASELKNKVDDNFCPDYKRKRRKELKYEVVVRKKLRSGFAEENSWLQTKTCTSFPRLPKCLDCKEGTDGAYCRFTMFRRLYTLDSGKIKTAGFCTSDAAEPDDLKPWVFQEENACVLDFDACKEILKDIGAQFEQLVLQELDTQKWNKRSGDIAWKRPVLQVRDMCDVCATTIFNTHWTCESCGFSVCLDCFHHELNQKDSNDWPVCNLDREHNLDELNITQSIPKNVLKNLYDDLLAVCRKIGLKFRQLDLLEFSRHRNVVDLHKMVKPNMNSLDILATIANIEHNDQLTEGSECNIPDSYQDIETNSECVWFCHGRMLHIQKSNFSDATMKVFKSEWRKGKPIIVSNVHHTLKKELWNPKSFCDDFGDELGDIVNCYDGNVIENFSVGQFWKGFECVKERPVLNGEAVSLLKLKDWPPGDDFKEKLPARFQDMMQALPAPEYTQRDGSLNLAARLPEFFAVPDLGPKMYNAYGSSSYPSAGTTNLHLDISDATNVICYVGIPVEEDIRHQEIQDTLNIVDKACCQVTQKRIRNLNVRPGALWHIFDAHDADKMRRFLIRISEERGMVLNENSDPIHDQSFYLDHNLLDRLRKEEGVIGYAICQCLGDAVYIPAGAPHQVLNLHSCIKVAEDFVAPEHITHCFQLTQEFRHLSDYHTNHEDKLQIKNIIYHSVKDCLGVVKKHHNIKTEPPATDF